MSSTVSTRLATAADAADALDAVCQSITKLCVADHQHDPETLERWLRNKTPEHFNRWCADPESRLVVAVIDAAIVGVAALHRSGEVRLFYVRPECIRSGAGRALLQAVEAFARAWRIKSLKLESTLSARRFYERCGFVSAGESTLHYGVLRGYPYTKALLD